MSILTLLMGRGAEPECCSHSGAGSSFFFLSLPVCYRRTYRRQLGAQLLVHSAYLPYRAKPREWSQFCSWPLSQVDLQSIQSIQHFSQLKKVWLSESNSASLLVRAVANNRKRVGLSLLPLGPGFKLKLFCMQLSLHFVSKLLTWTLPLWFDLTSWLGLRPDSSWQTSWLIIGLRLILITASRAAPDLDSPTQLPDTRGWGSTPPCVVTLSSHGLWLPLWTSVPLLPPVLFLSPYRVLHFKCRNC